MGWMKASAYGGSLCDVTTACKELYPNINRLRNDTFDTDAQAFYWIRQSMDYSEEGEILDKQTLLPW